MKQTILFLAALLLLGCTHTRTITTMDGASSELSELNRLGSRKTADVTLADRRSVRARLLQVAADSASWWDLRTQQFETVATSEIYSVDFKKGGQGALEGLGVGALIGGGLLALVGLASGDDPPCNSSGWSICFSFTAEDKAALGGVLGVVGGGFWGIILGAISGSKHQYIFSSPPDSDVLVFHPGLEPVERR